MSPGRARTDVPMDPPLSVLLSRRTKLYLLDLADYVHTRPFSTTFYIYLMFAAVKFLVYSGMRSLGFPNGKYIHDVAASCTGIMHSTIACVLSYEALRFRGWSWVWRDSLDLTSANTPLGTLTILYSLGYIIFDSVYIARYLPDDFLVQLHHLGSMVFMASNLLLRKGDSLCLLCVFFGEITNSTQNCWLIAKYSHQAGYVTDEVPYRALGTATFLALFLVRALYAP
ncbi:hypothetical protein T484DRAFT_1978904, partial [Baffinella frigidus]